MTNHIIKYILLILLAVPLRSYSAQSILDSLKTDLANARSASDSVAILYNIMDCSPLSQQAEIVAQLYDAACSSGDLHVINDALKLSCNANSSNDSILALLIERAENLPDSDDKISTVMFLKVRAKARQIRMLPEEKREALLREYLAKHSDSKNLDTYDRIEYLFYLCACLRMSTEGSMLTKYFQELQQLIDRLPARDISLKSLFYTQAAVSYLANEMYPETVEANRTLLEIIKELERKYAADGRIYRNYDSSKYVCFRRMLRCHDAISPEEIDFYYNKLIELADSDPSLKHDFDVLKRPTIYYMMAKKRYAQVIPLLRTQLDNPKNTREDQLYLVESLLKASEAVGDRDSQLLALQLHNQMLRNRIMAKAAESYKELQILYEVNDLKQANDDLVLANQQTALNRHKEHLILAVVGLILLIILLGIVFFYYLRARRLTASLSDSNTLIANERDNLKRTQKQLIQARDKAKASERIKTDFVNNMSHEIRSPLEAIVEYSGLIAECADEDKRGYIRRFADVISLNADVMLTIVNDVLELPSLENAKMSVNLAPASPLEICNEAIAGVKKHLRPGVELISNAPAESDLIIQTDHKRVRQILHSLLVNAAKFTTQGTIVLDYSLSDDNSHVIFSVTDTGIGIPQGKEEVIFSRFAKLDSSTQGSGLGLYISRLLAELLGGELSLDTDYRRGARFILSIPVNA